MHRAISEAVRTFSGEVVGIDPPVERREEQRPPKQHRTKPTDDHRGRQTALREQTSLFEG